MVIYRHRTYERAKSLPQQQIGSFQIFIIRFEKIVIKYDQANHAVVTEDYSIQ